MKQRRWLYRILAALIIGVIFISGCVTEKEEEIKKCYYPTQVDDLSKVAVQDFSPLYREVLKTTYPDKKHLFEDVIIVNGVYSNGPEKQLSTRVMKFNSVQTANEYWNIKPNEKSRELMKNAGLGNASWETCTLSDIPGKCMEAETGSQGYGITASVSSFKWRERDMIKTVTYTLHGNISAEERIKTIKSFVLLLKDCVPESELSRKCNFNRKIGEFNPLFGVQDVSPSFSMLYPNISVIQAAYTQETGNESKQATIYLYKFDSKEKTDEFYDKHCETREPCTFENIEGGCLFKASENTRNIPEYSFYFIWKEDNTVKDIQINSHLRKWKPGFGNTEDERKAVKIFNEYTTLSQEERQKLIAPFISVLKNCEP